MAIYPNKLEAVKAMFPGREVCEIDDNRFMVATGKKASPVKFRNIPSPGIPGEPGQWKTGMLLIDEDGNRTIDYLNREYRVYDPEWGPSEMFGRCIEIVKL